MKVNSPTMGGSRYYIEKEEDAEVYCVYDSETGEKVEDAEFPTRREAAAKLKELLTADAEAEKDGKKKKKTDDEEEDEDEGDHEYR